MQQRVRIESSSQTYHWELGAREKLGADPTAIVLACVLSRRGKESEGRPLHGQDIEHQEWERRLLQWWQLWGEQTLAMAASEEGELLVSDKEHLFAPAAGRCAVSSRLRIQPSPPAQNAERMQSPMVRDGPFFAR